MYFLSIRSVYMKCFVYEMDSSINLSELDLKHTLATHFCLTSCSMLKNETAALRYYKCVTSKETKMNNERELCLADITLKKSHFITFIFDHFS